MCHHTSGNISWNVLAPSWVQSLQRSFQSSELQLFLWKTKDRVCSRLRIWVSEMYSIERTKLATRQFHCSNEIRISYLNKKNRVCSRLHTQVSEMYIIERTKFATCKFHCLNEIRFRYLTKKKPCMFQVTHPSRWNVPHWKKKVCKM